ncbi:MAG: hypothetical protein V1921_05890 [Candidatus Altiarchaeota archaeon]
MSERIKHWVEKVRKGETENPLLDILPKTIQKIRERAREMVPEVPPEVREMQARIAQKFDYTAEMPLNLDVKSFEKFDPEHRFPAYYQNNRVGRFYHMTFDSHDAEGNTLKVPALLVIPKNIPEGVKNERGEIPAIIYSHGMRDDKDGTYQREIDKMTAAKTGTPVEEGIHQRIIEGIVGSGYAFIACDHPYHGELSNRWKQSSLGNSIGSMKAYMGALGYYEAWKAKKDGREYQYENLFIGRPELANNKKEGLIVGMVDTIVGVTRKIKSLGDRTVLAKDGIYRAVTSIRRELDLIDVGLDKASRGGPDVRIDLNRVGLLGISFGGIVGAIASGIDDRIKARVLINTGGVPDDRCDEIVEDIEKGVREGKLSRNDANRRIEVLEMINPANLIGPVAEHNPIPTLLLISGRDEVFSRRRSMLLADSARGDVRTKTYGNADHRIMPMDDVVRDVRGFFEEKFRIEKPKRWKRYFR